MYLKIKYKKSVKSLLKQKKKKKNACKLKNIILLTYNV